MAIIQWDLENDIEIESFDAGVNCKLFYDSRGESYITEDKHVVIQEQNVSLVCYDVSKINKTSMAKDNSYFDYYKGHRVDDVNHNWILFNEYISLSFSFMTFVIRGRSQESSSSYLDTNYVFD